MQARKNVNTTDYKKLPEEYVLYRIDKTTEEEQAILEEKGVKALYGDVDFDGYLTKNDVDLISDFASYQKSPTEMQKIVTDMDGDGAVNTSDVLCISKVINGVSSYANSVMDRE